MPINAFGGGPGSGKTYGVMEHVILPAVAKGRFILTNIEGLDQEAIYSHVAQNGPKGKIICIGHIRSCERSAPNEVDFFPGEDALDKPMPVPSPDLGRVCGGDLVVIDEATRYWPTGQKVKHTHAYFFREHRHFANEMGHTCDLVVIDPDLTLLARPLKGKVEMASVSHKPKQIGLNRYVVNLYRGVRLTGKPMQTLGPYAFKKEIFSLYKSYSHENAKEQAVDKRQNIFSGARVWGLIVLCAVVWVVAGYYTYRYFKPKAKEDAGGAKAAGNANLGGASKSAPANNASSKSVGAVGGVSVEWRLVGSYTANGEAYVVVADSVGRIRVESPSVFVNNGVAAVGEVDGRRVTSWSGGGARAGILPSSTEAAK